MRASIVTPTFNAARFIEACVLNVAEQGDAVLEHIVVDGGSTDGTLDAVHVLQERYPHLHIVYGPDQGQSDAMNKGSARARGEAIGILNVDDFYQPGAVGEGMVQLGRLRRPGLVTGDCRILDEHGATTLWNRPRDLRLESLLLGWGYAQFPCNPSAYFYHRAVHDLVGGYNVADHYAMDFDFILRCAEQVQMRYVSRHWGNFRLIPGCKTFEDPSGRTRVQAIAAEHRRGLSLYRRLNMSRIRRQKNLGRRLRRMLGGAEAPD